jgi:hypothetical protein
MRHLGVQRLVAFCLNDACRHQGLIDRDPGDPGPDGHLLALSLTGKQWR